MNSRRSSLLLSGLVLLAGPIGRPAGAAVAEPTTLPTAAAAGTVVAGQSEMTFTDRSPLSAPGEVARRLGEKQPFAADYKLADERFVVYVPAAPDDQGKYGIVAVAPYANDAQAPDKVHDLLDRRHLIYVTPKRPDVTGVRAGVLVDAVHNLRATFPIDDQRIYLLTEDKNGERLGLGYPDVFAGMAFSFDIGFWRPFRPTLPKDFLAKLPPGAHVEVQMNAAAFPPPPAAELVAARARPVVLAPPSDLPSPADYVRLFRADGFKRLTPVPVMSAELTCTVMSPGYLDKLVAPLDHPDAAPIAVATPAPTAVAAGGAAGLTTRPTADAATAHASPKPPAATPQTATKLYQLAQNYASAHRYDLAKAKLETLLAQFPNDAVAADARTLLDQVRAAQASQ